MNDIQFTYDFIRKSEVVKNNLIHMTDSVMGQLKFKGVMKLAKMLKKHKILTFFNQETNKVFFLRQDNPYLSTNSNTNWLVGVFVKDDNVVMLPATPKY